MEKLLGSNHLKTAAFFSLIYFIISFGFFPASTPAAGDKNPDSGIISLDAENGMGGMSYMENNELNAAASEIDPAAGIPEPEEYSKPRMLLYTAYTVQSGDNISQIAKDFGLNMDTLLSVNNIQHPRLIQIGQTLRVPNQDGIVYQVKPGNTLEGVAEKYRVDARSILTANELFSETLKGNTGLFLPGARLPSAELLEITGDLFLWPVRGYITSPYGYRISPFTGARQFHSGIDIGAPHGTPVKAAMSGRVSAAGYDNTFGNYVVITHHSGYRTLYGHMSVIRVKAGAYAGAGERIGDVGSTGLSTGSHLHFTVYKNGMTINPRGLVR
ncbi:MAG: M23 family metallopeptidase [Spirochaetaceae bacterium]|jgi:murein DD-endopeptidase MepM/ murein hydrolase activator NlpD|nr:M23 family metallopeptidase [Spirochaetaceae bacterium]